MDFKIFSPSYKRAKGVKTHKIVDRVIYCVHEFEKDEYLKEGYKIEVIPDEIRGNISRVRNYIKNNLFNGHSVIIDDDIEDIKYWTFVKGKPRHKSLDDFDKFLDIGFQMAEDCGARLWGVNILGDKGSYREYTPFSFTSTVSGSFMGFLNNEIQFDEKLPLKDDYDFCIQNLNKYRKILRFNAYSLVKKDHGNIGGCADYRNIETEREQLNLLREKWGSAIIKFDNPSSRNKNMKNFDINPIVKVPIRGV